jgi:hypothetical protein
MKRKRSIGGDEAKRREKKEDDKRQTAKEEGEGKLNTAAKRFEMQRKSVTDCKTNLRHRGPSPQLM